MILPLSYLPYPWISVSILKTSMPYHIGTNLPNQSPKTLVLNFEATEILDVPFVKKIKVHWFNECIELHNLTLLVFVEEVK